MDEMVSYIFRSMRSSELTLRGVKRVLKNQARRNRNFKRFAWLTVGYLVISEINRSPVSYTHLDAYKRQLYFSEKIVGGHRVCLERRAVV